MVDLLDLTILKILKELKEVGEKSRKVSMNKMEISGKRKPQTKKKL